MTARELAEKIRAAVLAEREGCGELARQQMEEAAGALAQAEETARTLTATNALVAAKAVAAVILDRIVNRPTPCDEHGWPVPCPFCSIPSPELAGAEEGARE